MRTCRAVALNGDDTYEVREFPIEDPLPGGAVVRVEAVGLCGSDIMHFYGDGHGHVPGEISPLVAGHETVGRVEALIADANFGVEVGQRVALGPSAPNPEKKMGLELCGYTLSPDEPGGPWGGYSEYMGLKPGTQLVPTLDQFDEALLMLDRKTVGRDAVRINLVHP